MQTTKFLLRVQGHDSADRAPALKDAFETVGGHAAQNWILLRLMAVSLADAIVPTDDMWKLSLLLCDSVNLACTRKTSLKELAELYLELIPELFPSATLKSKHHFLAHYPELPFNYGPLMCLWRPRRLPECQTSS